MDVREVQDPERARARRQDAQLFGAHREVAGLHKRSPGHHAGTGGSHGSGGHRRRLRGRSQPCPTPAGGLARGPHRCLSHDGLSPRSRRRRSDRSTAGGRDVRPPGWSLRPRGSPWSGDRRPGRHRP
ncbi:hypothetical protein ACFFX0_12390 [Citricoccus parietis]|uniref:Uncharacterized protein n=1 Tax=Citricoccus parietis TaxID=592307 RepID=A0ABV5FZW8_9MICC